MRPVNLIPEHKQQGARKPLRGGPLAYIVVGALVAVLARGHRPGRHRQPDLRQQGRNRPAAARRRGRQGARRSARRLHPVPRRPRAARRHRDQPRRQPLRLGAGDARTGAGPARGRLADQPDRHRHPRGHRRRTGGIELRASVAGPALELSGCASGQEAVAGFVQALKEIDGVTRVGVQSSNLGERESGGETTSGSASGGNCQTRSFIAEFQIVVAFDAAPVAATSGEIE